MGDARYSRRRFVFIGSPDGEGRSTGGYYLEVDYVGLSNIQSGSLPTELGGLTALTLVQADGQNLESTLPTELGRLTASTSLSINGA